MRCFAVVALFLSVAACGGGAPSPAAVDARAHDAAAPDAGAHDAATPDAGALDAPALDAGALDAAAACAVFGAPGQCITLDACAALGDHTSYPGYCPGPTNVQCCIQTPSVADNPPTPAGYRLMMQSEVTPAMTNWAVMILDDPVTYPMFSTAEMTFGAVDVLARVEWHPPDFNNSTVHRGVTLYTPL